MSRALWGSTCPGCWPRIGVGSYSTIDHVDDEEVLTHVRGLMSLWLDQQAATSERSAAEFARRAQDIRTGRSRRDWKPF